MALSKSSEWVANPLDPGQTSALQIKIDLLGRSTFICNTRFIVRIVLILQW